MPIAPFRAPAGYYQADDVNYPQRQSAIGGIVDANGKPNGTGSNMMGDPYTPEEIASAGGPLMKAPGVPLETPAWAKPQSPDRATQMAVTKLQPSRTQAFSTPDAQALNALDPRALEEAKALAALDQPKTMTGTFGGKSFEMTPAARVDRNVLAKLYNKYQGRQQQEREDAVRSQIQSGQERLATIPGQQANEGLKIKGDYGLKSQESEQKFKAPMQQADIAARNAATAATTGAEGRANQQFAERISPQQEAIDRQLAEAQASPFAQTPAGRARVAALWKLSQAGRAIPADQADAVASSVAGPPDTFSAARDISADPQVANFLAAIKANKQGLMFSPDRQNKSFAATRALRDYVTKYAQSKGVSFDDIWPQIQAQMTLAQ